MAELKQKQKFESLWNQFRTITGSQVPEQKIKIDSTSVPDIFKKVTADRMKKAEEAFEVKLLGIIETKEALDEALRKGKEDLAKKEEIEYEKLNKALSDAFSMLKMVQKQNQNLMNQAAGNFTPTSETDESVNGEEKDKGDGVSHEQ